MVKTGATKRNRTSTSRLTASTVNRLFFDGPLHHPYAQKSNAHLCACVNDGVWVIMVCSVAAQDAKRVHYICFFRVLIASASKDLSGHLRSVMPTSPRLSQLNLGGVDVEHEGGNHPDDVVGRPSFCIVTDRQRIRRETPRRLHSVDASALVVSRSPPTD
jgi:hypothetical protein